MCCRISTPEVSLEGPRKSFECTEWSGDITFGNESLVVMSL